MEDKKGEFFVIVAGYPNEMQDFLDANPGLRSRFTHTFNFEDYQPDELLEIFKKLIKDEDYRIADDAEKLLLKELGKIYRTRDKNFGNARTVRKLFEDAKLEVSKRYLTLQKHERTQEKLTTIYRDDIVTIVGAPKGKAAANLPINEEMLAEALAELEGLTGLLSVKKELREMVKLARFYKENGENMSDKFMSHILFLGSPGTGKTTVARIVSKIYSALAILPGGQLIETDRSGLVSGYVGQTAQKTTDAINSSMGGTLFIDEAYTLVKGGENDFGKEAIDTLLKRMEDDKGKFVVIAAGYTDEMKAFLESNPGMRSRFTKTFFFEDYIPDDLMKIFGFLCKKEGLWLEDAARELLLKHFNLIYRNRDKNFGNARIVRNIFDSANRNRILRLAGGSIKDNKTMFGLEDFPELNNLEPEKKPVIVQGDSDKLGVALEELNRLTGLEEVKENVARLVSSLKISRMRRERGMSVIQKPLHAVFTGGPGTGKTTVARLLSNIFRELGVVQKGHLVEVDRAQLVAGYSGQTAIKTDEVITKALGGVLFIDEAYTLARGGGDFGQEAIDTLLKRMEDYKDELVVIVAGYRDEMMRFIESNPGLQSRFTQEFYFEDYNPDQLENIVKGMAAKNGYTFDQNGADALFNLLVKLYNKRDKNFGNARTARNILLKIITNQEERISGILAPSNSDLQLLKQEDIPLN
ncbi:MAG: AAA family ATPase [Ignavibacteriales bacterium]|nr:AAA family ATPase [Ignavibacteriales bacterium]